MNQIEFDAAVQNHLLWINDKGNNKDKRLVLSGTFDGLSITEEMIAGAILKDCTFNNCSFIACFMQGVDFSNSTLIDCVLSGAILNESNFENSVVQNCKVENIRLNDAKLNGSMWPDTFFHGVIGDGVYIKNFAADEYIITYTANYVYADCQRKTIAEWNNVTDEELAIADGQKAIAAYYKLRFLAETKINSSPAKAFGT